MSDSAVLCSGLVLLALAGILDWATGTQIRLTLPYLLPLALITWRAGRRAGLLMAIACAAAWVLVDILGQHGAINLQVTIWNGILRVLGFGLVWALVSELMLRRRIERDLQKQTSILQSILDNMGDGVLVADARGALLHLNPTARRLLAVSSEVAGVNVAAPRSKGSCLENVLGLLDQQSALGRAMRGEVLNGVEMLLRCQDGSKACWISVTSRPMLDATGGCMGGVVVFSDVSARHELERQLVAAADSERRRIGEDLHDGLCQHLLSTALATQTLAAKLSARSLAEAEDASGIAELLGEAIAQARDTARGLYLVEAEAGGLRAALEAFAMDVRSRLRVACEFTENLSTPITDASMSVHLFRIAREAVNNAIRHAHASHITILLSTDEQRIVLTVEDDGEGFDKPNRNDGMGMHIMRYRARMLGATLEIGPRPAGGTSVICSVTRSDSTPKAPYAESN